MVGGMKDKHFIDWFSDNFGYGYGDGEQHILPALKGFLGACPADDGNYDYRAIERAIGKAETWFLINVLCKEGLIEYGTSPRYGWLDGRGKLLKVYVANKTADELYGIVMVNSDYTHCYPDACNCGEDGYRDGQKCGNPLWRGGS